MASGRYSKKARVSVAPFPGAKELFLWTAHPRPRWPHACIQEYVPARSTAWASEKGVARENTEDKMSTTGLEVFDTTIHKTNTWLNEIASELDTTDRHLAYHVLRAVLHVLRDRLTVEEAVQLGAQLPLLIRGVYYEGWSPTGKPLKWSKQEFLACIRDSFRSPMTVPAPERMVGAVFGTLVRHVSEGEVRNVKGILPKTLRELWPQVVSDGN